MSRDESAAATVRCGRVVDPGASYPHPCVLPEGHDGPCDPRPPETRSAAQIPDDCCPICTKDLESDGWCFECRTYPRKDRTAATASLQDEERTVLEVYSRTHRGLVPDAIQAVLASHDGLLGRLERAAFVAEHLFQMVDPQTWRDSGAIGPEGQYEGNYRAEQTREEIKSWTK